MVSSDKGVKKHLHVFPFVLGLIVSEDCRGFDAEVGHCSVFGLFAYEVIQSVHHV